MSEHAVYAPSSAHRWTVCTASASAIAQLGEQEKGEEAAEGTAAHDEIERCLGHMNGLVKGERYGIVAPDPDHPAAYGVALVLDYVRQLPPGTLWIEQRVRLTDQIWGRCDVAHYDPVARVLTIVDYKNGYVGVDAEENEQLQIYAAAVIMTYQLPVKWIRLAVVQPRDFRPVPRVKQWITSAEDMYRFATRVAAIPSGPLEFVAGTSCTYCPLFGRCPASQDVLVRLGTALASTPDQVRPEQRAIFAAMRKPLEDWFKSADKAWTKDALAGAVPPGMKLVTTQKHKAWKDEAAARALVVDRLGVSALDVPTPAQAIERGIPAVEVDAMAPRPEGGPALAFESDKRAPWARKDVKEMFRAAVEAERAA